MSRSHLLNLKKSNPLMAVCQERHVSPNVTARTKKQEQEDEVCKKLYTFCSSQNKPSQKQNDENKENVNMTARQRKVSLNNVKPKTSDNSKMAMNDISNKDKRKIVNSGNMSVTCINTLNTAFQRKKQQNSKVQQRQKEKKVNISISIHPKTIKDFDESNKKEMSTSRTFTLLKREKTPGKRSCEMKPLGNAYIQGGKQKIIVDEEELLKFTQKFAQDKYTCEEKIHSLELRLSQYEKLQNQWTIKSRQYDEYMMQAEEERFRLQEEVSELKSKVAMLRNDNEYYIMAKDQSRKIIKDKELEIALLNQQISQMKEELHKQKQTTLVLNESKADYKELVDAVRLLEIQNQHLTRELEINDAFSRQFIVRKSQSNIRESTNDIKVSRLTEQNKKMKEQMKEYYLQQIHTDIYQKTIEQCTTRLTALQEENDMLRAKFKFDCRSIKQSEDNSDFDYHSHHNQRSATQPSEVQCLWKRESSVGSSHQEADFRTRTFDSKILNISGIDWH